LSPLDALQLGYTVQFRYSPASMSDDYIQTLKNAILEILKEFKSCGISEYHLIQRLQKPPFYHFESLNFKCSFDLYKAHFLVFHSLYHLKQTIEKTSRAHLHISPLNITLRPFSRTQSTSSSSLEKCDIIQDQKLAEYYLDLNNMKDTSPADVQEMLQTFWTELTRSQNTIQHLVTLGLDQSANLADIKKRYRQLSAQNHPDRGGKTEKQQALNEAFRFLKTACSKY